MAAQDVSGSLVMNTRAQTLREEFANAVSHGFGFLLAVAAWPVLVWFGARADQGTQLVGASVFALTMMLAYGASALYHALPAGRAKEIAHRVDHAAIFLFIAGSFTPFGLGTLRTKWEWIGFGVVWLLAGIGMLAKLKDRLRHPLLSTALYLALGWLALGAAAPMLDRLPLPGVTLIIAGGAAYMVGAVFFVFDHRVRYGHFVWHLFVLAGSSCHFVAVLRHAPAAA
jgi:hemolysin III